jgi:hypothetical protein
VNLHPCFLALWPGCADPDDHWDDLQILSDPHPRMEPHGDLRFDGSASEPRGSADESETLLLPKNQECIYIVRMGEFFSVSDIAIATGHTLSKIYRTLDMWPEHGRCKYSSRVARPICNEHVKVDIAGDGGHHHRSSHAVSQTIPN